VTVDLTNQEIRDLCDVLSDREWSLSGFPTLDEQIEAARMMTLRLKLTTAIQQTYGKEQRGWNGDV
jgi:hypothetical protein